MHHVHDTIGCLRVSPPLNDVELDFLAELAESGETLRGTPRGRGRTEVPFARSAWGACEDGCCLWWNAELGEGRWMTVTLEFVVDHLLRPGAVGAGHPQLDDFTFDHVVNGVVVATLRAGTVVLAATDNAASVRSVPSPCGSTVANEEPGLPPSRTRTRPLPSNVVELRPRRA